MRFAEFLRIDVGTKGLGRRATTMTSEREADAFIQLPATSETVHAALLSVTLPDGTRIGRFRFGDGYLQHRGAVALNRAASAEKIRRLASGYGQASRAPTPALR